MPHGVTDGNESVFPMVGRVLAPGLTKREHIAALIIAGFAANSNPKAEAHAHHWASSAVSQADLLIEELNRVETQG